MMQGRSANIAVAVPLVLYFPDPAGTLVAIRRMHAAAQEVRRGFCT
jgi:hypothetical protein